MNKENLFDFDLDIINVKSEVVKVASTSDLNSCAGKCTIDCTGYRCPDRSMGVNSCPSDLTCNIRCRI